MTIRTKCCVDFDDDKLGLNIGFRPPPNFFILIEIL